MIAPKIDIPSDEIERFCRKWKITELALFGSAVRDDFRPDSDVDILVTFEPNATPGLKFFEAKRELEALLRRPVDMLTRRAVESHHNPWLKHSILSEARRVYPAA